MQKADLHRSIAAVVVTTGVEIGFAGMSMNATEPAVISPQSNDDNDVRVIKHTVDETEIAGTPERVVTLYSVFSDDVRALGVQSTVGTVNQDWINEWLTPLGLPLSDNAINVGIPDEPNLEMMAQLEHDLIIGMQAAHSEVYDDLSNIAPTILLDNGSSLDGPIMLEAVEQNAILIADVLSCHDDGATFLEQFNANLDQNERGLEQARLKGAKFILADVAVFESEPRLRLYVPNAQGSEAFESMGLKNMVTPTVEFQRFGNIDPSLEALATLDGHDVHFLYMQIPSKDPLTDQQYWGENPVWKNLFFVEEGCVYQLGSINMFYSVLMLEKLAYKATDELTK